MQIKVTNTDPAVILGSACSKPDPLRLSFVQKAHWCFSYSLHSSTLTSIPKEYVDVGVLVKENMLDKT